jgi:hypothetical protein
LGVTAADYITKNYAGLFLEWKARTKSKAEEMTFNAVGAGGKELVRRSR